MSVKIGLVICIVASIINYGVNRPLLFWLSIIALIISFGTSFFNGIIRARPVIKQKLEKCKQMKAEGATKEEIDVFFSDKRDAKALPYVRAPLWIPSLAYISMIAGVVLLIIGIVNRV